MLKKQVEMCGNLLTSDELKVYSVHPNELTDPEELFLYVENVGEESEHTQGMCQNKTYTTYAWHTHPISSKGYPSVADIFMPLRKRPNFSIIFTSWGIWELSSTHKYQISEEKREYLKDKYFRPILDKIYKYTNGGRGYSRAELAHFGRPKGDDRREYPLSKQQYSSVLQLIESLRKVLEKLNFRLKIKFERWEDIHDMYSI